MKMSRTQTLLALALVVPGLACGRQEVDIATLASNSDQVIWQAGQKALKGKQWDVARQHFRRIVDGFPQSPLVPEARIATGDAYFTEGGAGNYTLAAGQYREFLTVFPSHPRGDYAQFQIAESFFNQKNSYDRDQTQVSQALDEYLAFLDRYPESPLAKTARERVKACRGSLARSDFAVAWFYQKSRKAYRAAIPRYEDILKNFPDFDQTDETLLRLGQCLALSGREAEATPVLARLIDEYPDSPFVKEARAMMEPAPETDASKKKDKK
ncbi:MAG: outer membrane protein assembly factor BamD [Vicinamibacteria bacterium]|nr:outer membrane protein assembly factor BamD [Vicinamibacteria bacterium]